MLEQLGAQAGLTLLQLLDEARKLGGARRRGRARRLHLHGVREVGDEEPQELMWELGPRQSLLQLLDEAHEFGGVRHRGRAGRLHLHGGAGGGR